MSVAEPLAHVVVAAVAVPFAAAGVVAPLRRHPNLREAATLTAAAVLLLAVVALLPAVLAGARPQALEFDVADGLAIAFRVEPLGMLFALVASALWLVNSIRRVHPDLALSIN